MSVTSQLLELFRVDKLLRGLRSRLDGAERFLEQQQIQLKDLETRSATGEAQAKALRASIANDEGEAARLEEKISTLRNQMNTAKTAKEYNAVLTELGTFKDQKSIAESSALDAMGRADEFKRQSAEMRGQITERRKIVATAKTDRDTKEAEIKDRVEELKTQRASLAAEVPKESLALLDSLIKIRGDDAMAHVEVMDRRNYEYSCGACMMTLPMETVSSVVAGRLTRCVSCGCILYTEDTEIVKVKGAKPVPKTTPKTAKPKKEKSVG